MEFHHASLIDTRDAIASKKATAEQVTRSLLDRIDRLNPTLGVFQEVHHERALQRAQAVDRGEIAGPLAGVGLAVKDALCTAYGHTTCSSKMLANYRSPFTATVVQRLEDAGAVVLGKTRMDEFALGSSCENCAFGGTKNPWDLDRVPGGSSGGSAAAVAAGLCHVALGSDTGGSIRQPASLCGVVGFKPTYGRVSRYGLVACASSLDQVGPFTRTVQDAALVTQIMAGHDPRDSTCVDKHVDSELADLGSPTNPPRIGLAKQYAQQDANHPAVQQALEQAAESLEKRGASIVEIDLPHTHYGIPTYYVLMTAEVSSNLARYDGVHFGHRTSLDVPSDENSTAFLYSQSREEGFGDEVKRRIMLGTYALSSGYHEAYYDKALRVRRLIKQDFDRAFEQCDAVLCPTTTGPAFRLGEKVDDPLAMYLNDVYTVNANLAGLPGVSVPAGFAEVDGKNLPVGLQFIGPAFDEARLLQIAKLYESQAPPLRLPEL
jgi:aspartyl-tRNA(Asn)/glutamyl-tRNA(Gln) amidotransferase subunit A